MELIRTESGSGMDTVDDRRNASCAPAAQQL